MKYWYPVITWLIGFCVVLRYALLDFVLVSDAGNEFMVYSIVVETGKWQIIEGQGLLSSCLWTSYIPAMFQRFFNTDLLMTYKLFPCFIIPILPVAVYILARKWLVSRYAFLTAVFLMMQIYFLWGSAFARIMVALSFFSLALLVVFNDGLRFRIKVVLLVALSICLATAHYGTAFGVVIVIGTTSVVLLTLKVMKKYAYPYLKAVLVLAIILVIASVLWLGVINSTPLSTAKRVVDESVALKTYGVEDSVVTKEAGDTGESPASETRQVPGYFSLESREMVIQVAFGKTLPIMNVPQRIEFAVSWLTILLMSFGLVLMVKNWGFKNELVLLMCACYLIIVLSVVIPTIGCVYGIARVYFSMMVVLAPCFAIGADGLAERIKMPGSLLILMVLIPFGLCTSGIMHGFFGLVR